MNIANLISILSLVIAAVSIICSYFTWKKSDATTKRLNKINLESEFYIKIFKEYLITKIPTARNEIFINVGGKVSEYTRMTNTLIDLKREIKYFAYRNNSFYKELKRKIEAIEDYLINSNNRTYMGSDGSSYLYELDKMIEEFYKFVLNGYFGDN